MVTVGIRELKAKLSSYVLKVKNGETIIVTERGKDVAILEPISPAREAMMRLVREGKAKWGGGKPKGVRGVKIKGKPLSDTVLEDRR
jgi:prevent-host-death family protein